MARKRDDGGIGLGMAMLAVAAVWLAVSTPRTPQEGGAVARGGDPHGGERHADDAHGRNADSPAEIPARGWWEIVKRTLSDVSNNRLMTEAAGMTFFALLSVVPALAAMVSLYGLFADPATIAKHLDGVASVVPGGGMDIINDQVQRLTSNGPTALGFGLVIGLATSLWSANQGVKALFDSLNLVYAVKEKRGFLRRTLLSLGFTMVTILIVLVAMAAVVVLPIVLNFIGLSQGTDIMLRLARWPMLLIVVTLFLALVYRYGPCREKVRWRWVTWGGAFAAIVWALGSAGFSYYAANFGSYNQTYGSLGAIVGFMTWIWLSGLVVLIGAQLDAEMERQTARDTTAEPAHGMAPA